MPGRALMFLVAAALPSALEALHLQSDNSTPTALRGAFYERSSASQCDERRPPDALKECVACWLGKPNAPRLYFKEGIDGAGARVHDVIGAMAVAARNGLNLGGVITRNRCDEPHGVDVVKVVAQLLGLESPKILYVSRAPRFSAEYKGIKDMEKIFKKDGLPEDGTDVYLKQTCIACELDQTGINLTEYFSESFLKALRNPVYPSSVFNRALLFQRERPQVAVHVRRGDVFMNDTLRFTPDEWYYRIISQIEKALPNADVHVFSSLEDSHNASEFDGYTSRGWTMHLDGDILEPWAHFARAQVLVMAKSSFSHIPAILNDNCVIYQPYWHKPLAHWVTAQAFDQEIDSPPLSQAALSACLARASVHDPRDSSRA